MHNSALASRARIIFISYSVNLAFTAGNPEMIVEFHFIYVNVYKQDHLNSVKDNLVYLLFLTNCTLLLANYGSLNGTHVKNKMLMLMFCETTWYLNVTLAASQLQRQTV